MLIVPTDIMFLPPKSPRCLPLVSAGMLLVAASCIADKVEDYLQQLAVHVVNAIACPVGMDVTNGPAALVKPAIVYFGTFNSCVISLGLHPVKFAACVNRRASSAKNCC